MFKQTAASVRRVFLILSAITIVIAGICLIAGCLSIYDSGEFSRKAVAETFAKICIPVYICLAFTVFGFVWDMIFTHENTRQKAIGNDEIILKHLSSKRDINALDGKISENIKCERKLRRSNNIIQTAVICISSVIFLVYALNPNNFSNDINASVINAMRVLFPCVTASFVCSVTVLYINKKSTKREIGFLKAAPNRDKAENAEAATVSHGSKAMLTARIIILVFAVAILVYGFASGGTKDVLTKAVNICTECIGLG